MTKIEQITSVQAKKLVEGFELNKIEVEALDFCILMSTFIWAGFIDGKLACIWGVIPPTLMSNQAYLWLQTTDVIKEHQFVLVRHSQMVIKEMLKQYPHIVGHATMGATKSIRWLKWLGAVFGAPAGSNIPFRISSSYFNHEERAG